jgi:CubicO group peptidase (beta-lactamase class C family)
MIKRIVILILLLIPSVGKSQSMYFPPIVGNTWDTLSPASLGWCEPKIDSLLDYLEAKNSKAFILLKDGKIVIEKYFGTFTIDSAWYWASAGKTLTGFTLGIAQQEGFLSIQDTTSDYLGAGWTVCPPLKEDKITIRHQLTMTSGLDDGVPDHYCTLDTCLQYLADAGTRWAYHNGPYTLLDSVIESATGQSLNSYITQKIKNPTGMTGAFFPSGYNNVFFSKPRSMARFGLLMLNQGNWNGNQILTDTSYFQQMVNTSQPLNPSYGYLTWLNGKSSFMAPGLQFNFPGSFSPNAPNDMYAALGKDGQIINVVPSQNLVYIRMGNAPGVGEVPIAFNDTVWIKLNEVMCNATSLSSITQDKNISIYPNPTSDLLHIKFSDQKNYQLKLLDVACRILKVYDNLNTETQISTSGLRSGIYLLQFTNDDGFIYTHKVLVK